MESGVEIHGISHITGGGFYENVPRMMKDGLTANIRTDSFPRPVIFDILQKAGDIPTREMYNTFNMGTGLVIAVDSDKADEAVRILNSCGEQAAVIGEIKNGEKGVTLL